MDYQKAYRLLMQKGSKRGWSKKTAPCYTESHHIVPKWKGGGNEKENLVRLTAREHFIAHKLLFKAEKSTEATLAFVALCRLKRKSINKAFVVKAKDFAVARELAARLASARMKENNPQAGKSGKESHWFCGYYHTPAGVFLDIYTAAAANSIGKSSISRRCKNPDVMVNAPRLGKDKMGKTWRELGYWFEEEESVSIF